MPEIGATLREARTRAEVDVIEVEAATKIRAKYLRALESEDWDLLPGPTFVKSFLRTYADYLGLDARLLIEEYKTRYERPSDAELPSIAPSRERDRPPRRGIPRGAVLGVVLLGLVAALYALGEWGASNDAATPTAPRRHASPRRHRPAHRSARRRPAPVRPRRAAVRITATGRLYVCVADGTGRRLVPGRILAAGQSLRLGGPRLRVTLGNASVRLRVNGKEVTVPASPRAINYEITPAGRRPLPRGTASPCA